MTANLHAIWLDDLAPGEGATPIADQTLTDASPDVQASVLLAWTRGQLGNAVTL